MVDWGAEFLKLNYKFLGFSVLVHLSYLFYQADLNLTILEISNFILASGVPSVYRIDLQALTR